jgi:hypothetical protein
MSEQTHSRQNMSYDIIGDIHGHNDKLEALLRKLEYRNTSGTWRHPEQQAIFVGDFVDRGPSQVQTVNTVRRMIDSGTALAVMGNHELNAIAWHTPDPATPGEYLRPHYSAKWGEKNRKQHAAFLAEVEDKPGLHAEIIDWFLTLPLWLPLPDLRVVHACWHGSFMSWLSPRLHEGRWLNPDLMAAATTEPANESEKDDAAPTVFKAVEVLTKGIEIPLPDGRSFCDKDGIRRKRVRVRWWDRESTTYSSAAMLSPAERASLPDLPIPEHAWVEPLLKPTFFGHYWLTGTPLLQSNKAACVDYSAGNGGPLVAYRFEGEQGLSIDRFVSVT